MSFLAFAAASHVPGMKGKSGKWWAPKTGIVTSTQARPVEQ
jgi:hypothetical protein